MMKLYLFVMLGVAAFAPWGIAETGDLAATLYGVDLVGAAAGALIVSAVLLPLIGIVGVSCVVAALVFLSGLIATTAGRPSTAISS